MRKISPLYVHEAGPPNAPAIVFLHGLGASGSMWQPQFEHLRNYHCLAPDLPEHGKSANIGPFTLADSSERVAALIRERTRNGRASIVGLSMGGAVAVKKRVEAQAPTPFRKPSFSKSGGSLALSPPLAAVEKLTDPPLVRATVRSQSHRPAVARRKTGSGRNPCRSALTQRRASGKRLAASGSAVPTAAASAGRSLFGT